MKTIPKFFQAEISIKKSQFICRLFHAETSIEAKEIIDKVKNKHYDASHNCSAYITIDGEGYDDDGEPSGTAGKPMLNVLKKNDLKNIVAIVTRYFGGIKLGSSGLVRAYSKSVLETLAIAEIVEMKPYNLYEIIFDYSNIKLIDDEIRNNNITVLNKNFKEKIYYKIAIDYHKSINPFFEKLKPKIQSNNIGKKYLFFD